MKIIINVIAILFTATHLFANDALPFGPPIYSDNSIITVGVCAYLFKDNSAYPPITVYSAELHKSKKAGYKGAFVVSNFVQRSLTKNTEIIQKLQSFPVIEPGKYEVYFRSYKGELSVSYATVSTKTALINLPLKVDPPIVSVSQLVVKFVDMPDKMAIKSISSNPPEPIGTSLSDITP